MLDKLAECAHYLDQNGLYDDADAITAVIEHVAIASHREAGISDGLAEMIRQPHNPFAYIWNDRDKLEQKMNQLRPYAEGFIDPYWNQYNMLKDRIDELDSILDQQRNIFMPKPLT